MTRLQRFAIGSDARDRKNFRREGGRETPQKSLATLGQDRDRVNSARFCISPFSALDAACDSFSELRFSGLPLFDLGPTILQRYGSVEYQFSGLGFWIDTEISQAFELVAALDRGVCQ